MVRTCVDSLIESLSSLQAQLWISEEERDRLLDFEVELRFIKMFCYVSLDSDAGFKSILTSIECIWECIWEYDRVSEELRSLPCNQEMKKALDQLGKNILFSKQEIKKHCENLWSKSLTSKPFTSLEIQQILDAIIMDIDHLVSWVADKILPMKHQVETIKEQLWIFRNLVEFTGIRCVNGKALEDFNIHILTWAKKAACVTFLYWEAVQNDDFLVKITCGLLGKHESKEKRINLLVADLLHQANPCTLEFIDMCFAVIKVTNSSISDIFIFEEFVSDFVDLLLQNLIFFSEDDFRIIREGFICLITFLAGPPVNCAENYELMTQIDVVLVEASHVICLFGDAEVFFTSQKTVLANLMGMIDQVKGKINKHGIQLPHSSWSYFPRSNGVGFVESLLVYLKDLEKAMSRHPKLVASLKCQISTIKNELTSLRPFLQDISELLNEHKDISELLNEHKELKDLWKEIITLAYQAELAIKQSFFIDRPLCLSYVVRKIQAVQSKVMRAKAGQLLTTGVNSSFTSSPNMLIESVPTLGDGVDVVGFEEDAKQLIDRLTRGTRNLNIVPLVGMGGIGKTTLAKKLYNETSVRLHFHKRAFCTVSEVYNCKIILLDLLSHLTAIDDEVRNMKEEDLADMLRKNLSGCRYFIVLDNIWNVNAWNDLKDSFPNNNKGSRVMFTTRNVALLPNPDCIPHTLSPLLFNESWDLLCQKIFHKDPCPPYLCKVGRLIAERCGGLPLVIVVIAGLLKKSKSLPFWKKVSDNLTFYVSSKKCRDILDLSYKHLSEALKSCFLYLGAFPEDTEYRAGDITKLWIAEGFVPKLDRSYVDKIARKNLNDLGDRSLLIVTGRSCAGDIKSFRLHDVIRDFCKEKAQDEHVLRLVKGDGDDFSMPLIYDKYRICVQAECRHFLDANPRGPTMHSLLCFGKACYTYKCLTSSLFRNFKLIQVLNLQPVEFLDFPTGITMLVHLRYLALTCHCSVVPPTISNLQNLEALFIAAAQYSIIRFPDTIWKMKRLRHLVVPSGCILALDNIARLVFSQLPDLERLGLVWFWEKEEQEELLRRLPNVRKLSWHCYELPEQLVKLTKLESLHIVFSSLKFDTECSLSLPSTLRKLSLKGFQLPCRGLSTMIGINNLPCLQVLKLIDCRFHDNRWEVEEDEFPNLKRLTLENTKIKHWEAAIGSFPCLQKLVLENCRKLVEVPSCFGEVATLMALQVRGCGEGVETSAVHIQKEQFEAGNNTTLNWC